MKHERIGNFDCYLRNDGLSVGIEYPDCEGSKRFVTIDLVDVRAADDIRISYDKDRDGWLIEQQELIECPGRSCSPREDGESVWKEAAFVSAWQFTREDK